MKGAREMKRFFSVILALLALTGLALSLIHI